MTAHLNFEIPQLQRVMIAGEEVLYSPGAVMGFEFSTFAIPVEQTSAPAPEQAADNA